MDITKFYLNTIYLPYAISKINSFTKLNHDLKTDYNKYLDRESFINSDIQKLITLPIYSSEVFSNYISSLNNNYKLINQEKTFNREQLEKLDINQLKNILEELNETINNKYHIVKESLSKSETNYTTIFDQSTNNKFNYTLKNVFESCQSKENLLSKLDYSEYKKVDPAFYNEIFTIYKKLENKAVDLANVTYSLMGTKYETLLTLPTYLGVVYQAKIVNNLTENIKSTYSNLLSHIESNFIRELSSLGKTDFMSYFYNQKNFFNSNLPTQRISFQTINSELYYSILNKMKDYDSLAQTAEKIRTLLSFHGIVNSQNVLNNVMRISPQDLTEIDKVHYKRKLVKSIINNDSSNLLNTLDIMKFNYLHDFNSSSYLDKVVLYCYLNEINNGIMKSIKL